MNKSRMLVLLTLIILTLTACSQSEAVVEPPVTNQENTQDPPPEATTAPFIPPPDQIRTGEHVIGVRKNADGEGEFYNMETGETFVPRGVNHIVMIHNGAFFEDCAFGIGAYDQAAMEDVFATLASYGFNTVRMFIDICNSHSMGIGVPNGEGLRGEYLDNIVDTMWLAKKHGIFLLLTSNDMPDNGGYWAMTDEADRELYGYYRNAHYLSDQGIAANRKYWNDLMSGLAERSAPWEAVLAWQLLNEQWYFNNMPPINLTEGSITTANGKTYDLSSQAEKRTMLTENINHFIAETSEVIKTYDPTTLITMGFFGTREGPYFDDSIDFRYVDPGSLLETAPLDFFDFHGYPGEGHTIHLVAEDLGMIGYSEKPILMGEVGAFKHAFPTAQIGGQVVSDWVVDSCDYGFDGWLYWTYISAPLDVGDSTWGFTDADSYIMEMFAPSLHPDPCAITIHGGEAVNLAYGSEVTASRFETSDDVYKPENAVDFSMASWWSAAAGSPQWFQMDFGSPAAIESVRMTNEWGEKGRYVYRVLGKGPGTGGEFNLLATIEHTNDKSVAVLEHIFPEPISGIQVVKIEAVTHPGWVIWHEIEVYGRK